jgi:predicted nucleotide-binding protein (sugar kinase/HSP70/actin superfamily)
LKVGLPRALLYYKYGVLWEAFLRELSFEPDVSSPTNKRIISNGLNFAESEICLPVKVFYGHVAELIERGIRSVFIPRVVAVEKNAYTCPKFLGLPDMIRSSFPDISIITADFNRKKGILGFYRGFHQLAEYFGISKLKTIKAIIKAEEKYHKFRTFLEKGFSLKESWSSALQNRSLPAKTVERRGQPVIGIASHSYNIYDEYISLNLLKKLEDLEVNYLTPDNVPSHVWTRFSLHLPKFLFWTYERELLGSAVYWMEKKMIDGLIYVLSFACGPDSIVQYVLEDEAKKYGISFMTVVLDEHSAEAGLLTRLEAFTDMIRRTKR